MAKKSAQHWLMKSEPDVYSIDDLRRDGRSPWEGVRNYQARNHMRTMKVGDRVLYYHSSTKPPGVVGLARVLREAYPDHTQFDPTSDYHDPKATRDEPRWFMVDVAFERTFDSMVSLNSLKGEDALKDMLVVQRGQRLSVQPVSKEHFDHVCKMAK